jgi:hypothetical protein
VAVASPTVRASVGRYYQSSIGGPHVVSCLLSNAYSSAQDNKDQVKRDVQTGRHRAQQQAEQAKQQAQVRNSAGAPGARPRI